MERARGRIPCTLGSLCLELARTVRGPSRVRPHVQGTGGGGGGGGGVCLGALYNEAQCIMDNGDMRPPP